MTLLVFDTNQEDPPGMLDSVVRTRTRSCLACWITYPLSLEEVLFTFLCLVHAYRDTPFPVHQHEPFRHRPQFL
jgi:hypothetical protein